MKIEKYHVGLVYYQSQITRQGRELDVEMGDWTTRAEAEEEAAEMVASFEDTAVHPRDECEWWTRKYICDSIEEDGCFGSGHTID